MFPPVKYHFSDSGWLSVIFLSIYPLWERSCLYRYRAYDKYLQAGHTWSKSSGDLHRSQGNGVTGTDCHADELYSPLAPLPAPIVWLTFVQGLSHNVIDYWPCGCGEPGDTSRAGVWGFLTHQTYPADLTVVSRLQDHFPQSRSKTGNR